MPVFSSPNNIKFQSGAIGKVLFAPSAPDWWEELFINEEGIIFEFIKD